MGPQLLKEASHVDADITFASEAMFGAGKASVPQSLQPYRHAER